MKIHPIVILPIIPNFMWIQENSDGERIEEGKARQLFESQHQLHSKFIKQVSWGYEPKSDVRCVKKSQNLIFIYISLSLSVYKSNTNRTHRQPWPGCRRNSQNNRRRNVLCLVTDWQSSEIKKCQNSKQNISATTTNTIIFLPPKLSLAEICSIE